MYLIAGLGNPGEKYASTRHNSGFMTATLLAEKNNITLNKTGCNAVYGKGKICGEDVIIALPQTYMNESGIAVKGLMSYFKIDINNVIIIYDDMDIDVGAIRIKPDGSAGSHNGMKSVIFHLNSDIFKRVRIGIGRPEHNDTVDFVLGRFPVSQHEALTEAMENASDAIECIISKGIEPAMNKYNKKKKQ